MKKSLVVKMVISLSMLTALSGCLWVPVDDGYRGDGYRDRGHDEHRREHDEGHGERR